LAALAVLLSLLTAPALAEKRIALVIGNSAYQNVTRLDNPRNDAVLMAETLGGLGFTLIGGRAQLDLDRPAMDTAVQNFGRQVQGADVALFYYAGHGVQVSGANYLVPVSANPTREADVDFQMVDVNLVLRQMQGSGTRLNMVILDACRNNPFGARGLRASDGGLAQMRAPEGTLISYATQPGNVAQDGADGHSPYTKALAATIVNSMGCGGSSTTAVVVTSGRIIGEGLTGTISANGVSHSVDIYNGITVISNGRASGRSDSGAFQQSDGCSGTWLSSKQ
jgi:hypothetical protein